MSQREKRLYERGGNRLFSIPKADARTRTGEPVFTAEGNKVLHRAGFWGHRRMSRVRIGTTAMDYLGSVIVAQKDCVIVRAGGEQLGKFASAAAARTFIRRRRRLERVAT